MVFTCQPSTVLRLAGLFLGGYYALAHIDDLGITHILSVVNGPVSRTMCTEILGSPHDNMSAAGRELVRHHVRAVLDEILSVCCVMSIMHYGDACAVALGSH